MTSNVTFTFTLCIAALVSSWSAASQTQVVALTGDPAPDGNGSFSSFGFGAALNDAGQAAFRGELTGTTGGSADDVGLFRGDEVNSPVQIAREGQAAPDGNGTFSDFGIPLLNETGKVAFGGTLVGASGGFNTNTGIFAAMGWPRPSESLASAKPPLMVMVSSRLSTTTSLSTTQTRLRSAAR